MTSRRNFFKLFFSQLYVLPVLSVNAVIQACSYNKGEIELPELQLLPLPDMIYEGESFIVQWQSSNIETVVLQLVAADASVLYQTQVTARTQSFTVTNFIASGDYKIHLSDKLNNTIHSESPFFTVLPSRQAVLAIHPVQTMVYENESFTITWTSTNVTQIEVVVIHNVNGIVSSSTTDAALQSYTLTITDHGDYTIQLISTTDPNLISESQPFSVLVRQGTLAISYPNGGESFSVLQHLSIEWEATKITTVNLYYSINNGQHWLSIVTGIPALSGSYPWQLPDVDSSTYRIKIEDAQNQNIFDSSDNVFTVVARYDIDLDLYPELTLVGGYKVFQTNALGNYTLVRISATAFKAYSHICTHNGCTIALLASKMYSCSCHGSEFDFDGNVTHGPAMRPLDLFTATFNAAANVVVVEG